MSLGTDAIALNMVTSDETVEIAWEILDDTDRGAAGDLYDALMSNAWRQFSEGARGEAARAWHEVLRSVAARLDKFDMGAEATKLEGVAELLAASARAGRERPVDPLVDGTKERDERFLLVAAHAAGEEGLRFSHFAGEAHPIRRRTLECRVADLAADRLLVRKALGGGDMELRITEKGRKSLG